jgi:sulfur relay (sulfurtransferase) DsrF/TusC family protein
VIKSPLYGSGKAAEGFRMATAMIAMDVLPQILFIDDGVYCLVSDQRPEVAGLVSFGERLKALADLVGLFVVSESLKQRKLRSTDLDGKYNIKMISLDETASLFSQNNIVITF